MLNQTKYISSCYDKIMHHSHKNNMYNPSIFAVHTNESAVLAFLKTKTWLSNNN